MASTQKKSIEAADPIGFWSELNEYFAALVRLPEVLGTHAFNSFFRLSPEYQERQPSKFATQASSMALSLASGTPMPRKHSVGAKSILGGAVLTPISPEGCAGGIDTSVRSVALAGHSVVAVTKAQALGCASLAAVNPRRDGGYAMPAGNSPHCRNDPTIVGVAGYTIEPSAAGNQKFQLPFHDLAQCDWNSDVPFGPPEASTVPSERQSLSSEFPEMFFPSSLVDGAVTVAREAAIGIESWYNWLTGSAESEAEKPDTVVFVPEVDFYLRYQSNEL